MQITIFDDKKSLIHFALGLISPFIPLLIVIFVIYEFLEYSFSNCETMECFIGDIAEFSLGYLIAGAGISLLMRAL